VATARPARPASTRRPIENSGGRGEAAAVSTTAVTTRVVGAGVVRARLPGATARGMHARVAAPHREAEGVHRAGSVARARVTHWGLDVARTWGRQGGRQGGKCTCKCTCKCIVIGPLKCY
jgi:hypothetical protein